jgi:hypothetical protein
MANKETLNFKLGLSGTYWDKKPIFSVLVNDHIKETRQVDAPTDEVFYVEFAHEVEEGPCTLKIRLENKTQSDVVKDDHHAEEFKILKDMLLNIESIEIDDIDLGNLLYSKSEYIGDDAERPTLIQCVNLGWNGTWSLPFASPFYIWLLENI